MVLKGRKDLSYKRAWEHFKFYKNEKDVYSNDDQGFPTKLIIDFYQGLSFDTHQ